MKKCIKCETIYNDAKYKKCPKCNFGKAKNYAFVRQVEEDKQEVEKISHFVVVSDVSDVSDVRDVW